MKALTAILFLSFQLTTSAQRDSTVIYDDLCDGCCGLRLSLYSNGTLDYIRNGVARFDGRGTWSLRNDTLIVVYDGFDRTERFIQTDSLTLIRFNSSHSLPLLKMQTIYYNGRWLAYTYNKNKSIRYLASYENGVLKQLSEFNGKLHCQTTFESNGQITSDGCFRNGKKVGKWFQFNPSRLMWKENY